MERGAQRAQTFWYLLPARGRFKKQQQIFCTVIKLDEENFYRSTTSTALVNMFVMRAVLAVTNLLV